MKILGLSCGTKNGNNDTMCRVALEAARDAGAEIEFIHVFDWDIKYCTGCVACSKGLVMGKGMICTQKDDYAALYEKMVEADGILVVDPIYESGGSGLFHVLTDRMGPGHDTGMLLMLDGKLKEQGKQAFFLDSKEPTGNLDEFLNGEVRYNSLKRANPERAARLFAKNAKCNAERYEYLKKLVTLYGPTEE